ncbi:MAG: uroporphyrinogen-III synthase [Amphiplicatus sp.]|nr:uroporphyrinogen-III synthase [Amphiplicatus sp.]MCB9955240.1 uroporphyrinogen-III synthase [Caulobacterales bacterium]
MRIIVTRPAPDAEAFAALARTAGFEPVLSPVMAIDFGKAPPSLKGVGALAFTSANGVRAFCGLSGDRSLPVFAVGAMTAEEARRDGFENVIAAGGDVASLTEAIAAAPTSGDVLHIAGAERAGDLVAALETRGVGARRAVLYEAVPVTSLADEAVASLAGEPAAEAAALFSPRSASLFIALVRQAGLEARLADVVAACLSEAVADAVRGVQWKSVVIAGERNSESLLAALANEITTSRG